MKKKFDGGASNVFIVDAISALQLMQSYFSETEKRAFVRKKNSLHSVTRTSFFCENSCNKIRLDWTGYFTKNIDYRPCMQTDGVSITADVFLTNCSAPTI